jgi:hypothetical protein
LYNDDEQRRLSQWLSQPKEYDVVMVPDDNSPRRIAIRDQLMSRGFSVLCLRGRHGDDRDQMIAKSRILVNIHKTPQHQIFEHYRCDRWIMSGLCVVSETSLSDELMDSHQLNLVTICPYDQIVDRIAQILEDYSSWIDRSRTGLPQLIQLREKQANAIFPVVHNK